MTAWLAILSQVWWQRFLCLCACCCCCVYLLLPLFLLKLLCCSIKSLLKQQPPCIAFPSHYSASSLCSTTSHLAWHGQHAHPKHKPPSTLAWLPLLLVCLGLPHAACFVLAPLFLPLPSRLLPLVASLPAPSCPSHRTGQGRDLPCRCTSLPHFLSLSFRLLCCSGKQGGIVVGGRAGTGRAGRLGTVLCYLVCSFSLPHTHYHPFFCLLLPFFLSTPALLFTFHYCYCTLACMAIPSVWRPGTRPPKMETGRTGFFGRGKTKASARGRLVN